VAKKKTVDEEKLKHFITSLQNHYFIFV